ncbi:hypothetical protein AQI94_29760 [Streptomyces pseudovenezuelae]|uniref:Uncharacterized protein n=1 Tax=Streptomyces pseudovenezuelae TaxID=67350 RepID=A0A101N1D6_9ACTN|nr:hypothetical protein AQI94_29760 [Streptomyces pseudovenezuelae]
MKCGSWGSDRYAFPVAASAESYVGSPSSRCSAPARSVEGVAARAPQGLGGRGERLRAEEHGEQGADGGGEDTGVEDPPEATSQVALEGAERGEQQDPEDQHRGRLPGEGGAGGRVLGVEAVVVARPPCRRCGPRATDLLQHRLLPAARTLCMDPVRIRPCGVRTPSVAAAGPREAA